MPLLPTRTKLLLTRPLPLMITMKLSSSTEGCAAKQQLLLAVCPCVGKTTAGCEPQDCAQAARLPQRDRALCCNVCFQLGCAMLPLLMQLPNCRADAGPAHGCTRAWNACATACPPHAGAPTGCEGRALQRGPVQRKAETMHRRVKVTLAASRRQSPRHIAQLRVCARAESCARRPASSGTWSPRRGGGRLMHVQVS